MSTHFSQLFWGLLLVILDFSINGFDLLVDGLGYLIVAAGCGGLASLSRRFAVARVLCFVLAAMWLLGFAIPGEIGAFFGIGTTIVNCAMIWQLLGGISEFAMAQQRPDLSIRACNRRLAYVIIMAATTFLGYTMSGSGNTSELAIALIVSMLVLIVMILHLIHRVRVELAT